MKIFLTERIEENNILEYIKYKLNLKDLYFLASGEEGAVYEIDKFRVIKLTKNNPYMFKHFLNKQFKHLMNVYNIGEIEIPSKFIGSGQIYLPPIKFFELNSNHKLYYIISENLVYLPDKIVNYVYEIMDIYAKYTREYKKNSLYVIRNHKKSLLEAIKQNKKLDDKGKLIGYQIVAAMQELVDNGIEDFDLHEGNIMLDRKGNIKLIDFDDNFYGYKSEILNNRIR